MILCLTRSLTQESFEFDAFINALVHTTLCKKLMPQIVLYLKQLYNFFFLSVLMLLMIYKQGLEKENGEVRLIEVDFFRLIYFLKQ